MNKLLEVSRQGGFPWTAETVEALNENVRYIEAIMDGFNIGSRQAIILSDRIMYIKDAGWTSGKIVKTFTDIDPSDPDYPATRKPLLENPSKYASIDRSTKIRINKQDSITEVYPDVILQEEYEISLAGNNNPGWTFFEMADFFERERMVAIPNNSLILRDGGWSNATTMLNPKSIIRYNKLKTKLDIQLILEHDMGYISPITIEIPAQYANDMNFPIDCAFGLTCVTGQFKDDPPQRINIPSYIWRETSSNIFIVVCFDYSASQGVASVQTIISGSIILN